MNNEILWASSDSRKEKTALSRFIRNLESSKIVDWDLHDYKLLHKFSVEYADYFWKSLIEFFDITCSGKLVPSNFCTNFDEYAWFPNTKLNFCENLLRLGVSAGPPSDIAIDFLHESGLKRQISYGELYENTKECANYLKGYVGKGDVVAAYMPNIPETVIAMLATTSLGGIFTSTSCDFGVQGVIDRFGQTMPKVLVAATSYSYNGKVFDQTEKIAQIKLEIPSIEHVILVNFLDGPIVQEISNSIEWKELPKGGDDLVFEHFDFNHPLYIMYSSGTTGKPKCIVHSTGGVLLQHVKELGLHTDLIDEKSIFYFTTCGWMMWNWLVSSLFFGARVILYEGSPSYPDLNAFLDRLGELNIDIWGTSPKFLQFLQKSEITYQEKVLFKNLETILSTGAPLAPEQFDFVYQELTSDVLLASISGGTDIIGCFMLGNPMLPVRRGHIQCLGLGMNVAAFDENGESVTNLVGELVCLSPFPSRPVGFWNDPDKSKFKAAYFEKYPDIWHHGDFIEISSEGTVQVFGRSDATLNPGGVRIGTAEIYRHIEGLPFVEDALCVGLNSNDDVLVVLFVKMCGGEKLNLDHISNIKKVLRENASPRHVPWKVFETDQIPYTRSGKKMEILVSRILNGGEVNNLEAVANTDSLAYFEKIKTTLVE